jgi:hypothetical protein
MREPSCRQLPVKPNCLALFAVLALPAGAGITMDTTAAPEHAAWAAKALPVATEWLPRLANLLAVPGSGGLPDVTVKITPEYKGVAFASGSGITMASAWVRDHPEDSVGALIHELVHVLQGYPGGSEHWLTEGIADYQRFSVYEGKPAGYFPKPAKVQGYRDAYQVAAGFLAWLEAGEAPGVVRRLHAALRGKKYTPELFVKAAGKPLDELWREYTAASVAGKKLPSGLTKLSYKQNGGGAFVAGAGGEWVEVQGGKEHARFKETARSDEAVELHDAARGIRLRLGADSVSLQRNGAWSPLYAAEWEAKP